MYSYFKKIKNILSKLVIWDASFKCCKTSINYTIFPKEALLLSSREKSTSLFQLKTASLNIFKTIISMKCKIRNL